MVHGVSSVHHYNTSPTASPTHFGYALPQKSRSSSSGFSIPNVPANCQSSYNSGVLSPTFGVPSAPDPRYVLNNCIGNDILAGTISQTPQVAKKQTVLCDVTNQSNGSQIGSQSSASLSTLCFRTSSPPASYNPSQASSASVSFASSAKQEPKLFDEFDPCGSVSGGPFGSVSATPTTSNNAVLDLLSSLLLAFVPSTSTTTKSEVDGLVSTPSVTTFIATSPNTTMLNCKQASRPIDGAMAITSPHSSGLTQVF
ncbi:uncharacterized serine-rich protein C215.13-like [Rosa rugosa]|uniref:uncharacterized serine-rich protein C215.13-like n=1 Tax=Rosa rugosa TaxID=74645 RepID=UPI002B40C55D|nr:uncharacterized serine-rich protein C215.13-like [Rosa rugosa]